jgi:DNA-binding transcriptional ArsR family regulator
LRAQIKIDGAELNVEGEPDEVLRGVISFISKIAPAFNIASRMVYYPDFASIMNDLAGFVKISQEGELIQIDQTSPADRSVGFLLLGALTANKLGLRESDSMPVEELARTLGKALKTVRNTVVELQKAGLVERTARGTYRITTNGVARLHEELKAQIASQHGKEAVE